MHHSDRQSYEAALNRARRDLLKASDIAQLNNDEGASTDLVGICAEVTRVLKASHDERRPKGASRPIKGQTTVDEQLAASEPQLGPKRARARSK